MRIDCETIPDPQPRLETSEETPEGKQDSQAGSHEMVVAGVKRKAVEPVATTGLSQAGKLEAVEMANFGSDGLPSSQGVMNFIAHKYFQTVDTTKPEKIEWFSTVFNRCAQSSVPGCSIRKFDIDSPL